VSGLILRTTQTKENGFAIWNVECREPVQVRLTSGSGQRICDVGVQEVRRGKEGTECADSSMGNETKNIK